MIARRILVHSAALIAGGSIGVVVGGVMHTQLQLDSIVFVAVVAAFIFLSQVVANFLVERSASAAPRAPVFREPVIRGTDTWGWLKPASGIGAGFPLNKECIRMGRGVEMDITLNNASISRRHAQLRRLAEGGLLEDLGSRNGIFVNGVRVKEQTLSDGDHVTVGEMKFVFVRMGAASRAAFAGVDEAPREEAPRDLRATAEIRDVSRPPRKGEEPRAEEKAATENDVRPFDETCEYDHDEEEEHDD